MKKKEFLDELGKILEENKCSDKEEILKDFEEHFSVGIEEGKSEEEVAKMLGNPRDIAMQFILEENKEDKKQEPIKAEVITEQTNVKKENNTAISKILIALALIFFNIVFVFGIVCGLLGALVGCLAAFIAVSIVGIVLIVAGIIGLIAGIAFIASKLMAVVWIFAGIGVTCLRSIINHCNCNFKYKICKIINKILSVEY